MADITKTNEQTTAWDKNLERLKNGEFGDYKIPEESPEVMLRYWRAQAEANYPNASENVQYWEEQVQRQKPKNLNREQIKKELVLLIDDMPLELHLHHKETLKFLSFLKSILHVITADEQKIFELENRLKECENGYEGTLFLDRCKLHDAEEKIKKLTEERDIFKTCADNLQAFIRSWDKKEQIGYEPTAARAAAEAEMWQRIALEHKRLTDENEKIGIENFELICELSRIKADTVRKIQERFDNRIKDKLAYHGWYLKETVIPTIAKEMLEDNK